MDIDSSDTKQDTPNVSQNTENVDVEMNLSATVLTKVDPSPAADENQNGEKKKAKKKKKTTAASPNNAKKPKKDPNKPEYPKVGYVRFMYVRREELRTQFPDMHHLDVTKKIGEEWTALSDEQKKPYLDAAAEDKMRYQNEMKEYNKKLQKSGDTKKPIKRKKKTKKADHSTDTDFEPTPKKTKRRGVEAPTEAITTPTKPTPSKKPKATSSTVDAISVIPKISSINTPPPSPPVNLLSTFGDIPIFTDQFLDHNRQMEAELKRIRKMNTDIDQQNSVLEKYADSVQNGISKTQTEIDELKCDNGKLAAYLNELRTKLVGKLQHLCIPNEPNGANMENIDKFMEELFVMAQTNEHGPASLNKAKDLLRKVDLNINVNNRQKDATEAN